MGSVEGPALQRIDRSETERIIQAIVNDGGVIIKGFATREAVERVNADTRPFLDNDKPWKVKKANYSTFKDLLMKVGRLVPTGDSEVYSPSRSEQDCAR